MLRARSPARMQEMQSDRLQGRPAARHPPTAEFGRPSQAYALREGAARPTTDFEPWNTNSNAPRDVLRHGGPLTDAGEFREEHHSPHVKSNALRNVPRQGGPSAYKSEFREEFHPPQLNLHGDVRHLEDTRQRDAGGRGRRPPSPTVSRDCERDSFQREFPPQLRHREYEEAPDSRLSASLHAETRREGLRPQRVWEGRPVGDAEGDAPCRPRSYDDGIPISTSGHRQLADERAAERDCPSHAWVGEAGHKRTRSEWVDEEVDRGLPRVRARPALREEHVGPRAAMPRGSLASYATDGNGIPLDTEGVPRMREGRWIARGERRPCLDQGASDAYGSDIYPAPHPASRGDLDHVSDRSRSFNPVSRRLLPPDADREEGYHSRYGCPTRGQSPDREEGPIWRSNVAMHSRGPNPALTRNFNEGETRKGHRVWEEGVRAGEPQATWETNVDRQRPQGPDGRDVYASREGQGLDRVWLQHGNGDGPEVCGSHNTQRAAKAELKRRRRVLLAAVQEQLEEVLLESD